MAERTRARTTDDGDDEVYRLRDIVAEEISIVDRAANRRRFLIVKRSGLMSHDDAEEETPDVSGETPTDGDIEKAKAKPTSRGEGSDEDSQETKGKKPDDEEDAGATRKTRGARGGKAADEEDEEEEEAPQKKPRRKADPATLSAPVREHLLAKVTEALDRLLDVANRVKDAGESESEGDAAVPDEIGREAEAIAKLLSGLGERPTSAATETSVSKAGARMSRNRLDRFQKAMALLADVLKELTDIKELGMPNAGAAAAPAAKSEQTATDAVAPVLAEITAGLREMTRAVKRQEEELASIRKARAVSNVIPVEGSRRTEPQEVSWPLDMNRPISRDKVREEVSFYGNET